jgi:hypothetical protein
LEMLALREHTGRRKSEDNKDNRLCAFCLLHDRAIVCRAKENKDRLACGVPECEGRHAMRLHELLKDIYGERSRVHLVQGDDKEPSRTAPLGAGGELANLMRGLMGAQANDSGWPMFSGKYAEYPRFRKEWWAYRQMYHGHDGQL